MTKTAPGRLGALAAAAVTLIAPLAVLTATTGPAEAAVNDQGISGAASPIWQTNGNVEAIVPTGGNVYVGGAFTRVRPPGAAAGSQETARSNLAAFNVNTGALTTGFNVTLNGAVEDMTMSPNGSLLYIAGRFTTVNGVARSRVAAINLPAGTLNTAFTANANNTATSIDATGSTVYVGGDFTTVNGVGKSRFASVNATTGGVNPFTAALNNRAYTIDIAPDNSRVLVGGNFTTVNGSAIAGIASVHPTTGVAQTWLANQTQPVNTNCGGRVTDIVTSGTTAFVTAEGDPPGCYEGTYSARISDGQLSWNSQCLGASQGLTVLNGILYKASHQHDCAFTRGGAGGGFVGGTNRDNFLHYYLAGQNTATGDFVHWTPDTNAGAAPTVGPHVIATNGSQLFVGGDFTRVNGVLQQGLTRFQPGNGGAPAIPGRNIQADPWPNTVRKTASTLPVTVQPTRAGTLTVTVPAVEDPDSGTLTYRIYRDGGATPVSTQTIESFPWSRPVVRFDDAGMAAGSTHSYRVTASDGTRTSALSTAVPGTVSTGAPQSLATAYAALAPQLWWRLNDSGPAVADSSSTGLSTGTTQGGTTTGQAGAVTGNAAVTLNGSSGYVASNRAITAPNAFTESAWFRTTTVTGGNILSQSDQATGSGGNTDRTITMDNNGGLVFAMKVPGTPSPFGAPTINIRNQGPVWNDGRWHLVTGTYDGNGNASLYVDGTLQGTATGTPFDETAEATGMPTSFQRAGYGDLTNMQIVFGINFYNNHWPVRDFFAGSIDEVASFNRALTQAQVRTMFASGVAGGA